MCAVYCEGRHPSCGIADVSSVLAALCSTELKAEAGCSDCTDIRSEVISTKLLCALGDPIHQPAKTERNLLCDSNGE